MPSLVERKQAETGKWFLVHSSISLPRRAADHGSGPRPRPRISKSSPGTEGLGSEPPDEPVAGPDSTWSFERQAPAACSGTKGILYTITSRGVAMRTLHGVSSRTRYRVSSPRVVCLHANEPPSSQTERPSSVGMGPRCPIWTRMVRRCQVRISA